MCFVSWRKADERCLFNLDCDVLMSPVVCFLLLFAFGMEAALCVKSFWSDGSYLVNMKEFIYIECHLSVNIDERFA